MLLHPGCINPLLLVAKSRNSMRCLRPLLQVEEADANFLVSAGGPKGVTSMMRVGAWGKEVGGMGDPVLIVAALLHCSHSCPT
jgi:hypothetical protein